MSAKRFKNPIKINISSQNIYKVIVLAHADLKKDGKCVFSSVLYKMLVDKNKITDYNSFVVLEMRKSKYAELRQNPELKKVSEQFPNFFKNSTVRQHVQSDLVNQYLRGFDSVEEIINDLKQK